MTDTLESLIRRVPGARRIRRAIEGRFNRLALNKFLTYAPPGHYYSPIPGDADIERVSAAIGQDAGTIPGIDLQDPGQRALLDELAPFYAEQPFPEKLAPDRRYTFDNALFCYADALALYGMLRHFRPRRVIEVGSGYSSAAMLDTSELFLNDQTAFTFIDPSPARLLSLLRSSDLDRVTILPMPVQDVPLDTFTALKANDILFIDSSHVAKAGSDVVHLLNTIVPSLNPGVLVHIHDIFWPFEYPPEWLREGRAWNEIYMVRAFLQFNDCFRILLFNDYLAVRHRDWLTACCPLALGDPGGSLWLLRTV